MEPKQKSPARMFVYKDDAVQAVLAYCGEYRIKHNQTIPIWTVRSEELDIGKGAAPKPKGGKYILATAAITTGLILLILLPYLGYLQHEERMRGEAHKAELAGIEAERKAERARIEEDQRRKDKALDHLRTAELFAGKGANTEALEFIGRAIESFPLPAAFFKRAGLRWEVQDLDGAAADYRDFLDRAEGSSEDSTYALLRLTEFECIRGKYGQAVSWADQLLTTEPKNSTAMIWKAEALLADGRESEAFAVFQKVVQTAPSYALVDHRADITRLTRGMIRVPAGRYLAGPEKMPRWMPEYYISTHEVTATEYLAFCQTTGHVRPAYPSRTDDPQSPIVFVSKWDAIDYCDHLGVRLPTYFEWEKAARGTDGRTYPWGEADPGQGESCIANIAARGVRTPQPVGAFPQDRSPYGCFDMAGNVTEIVLLPLETPTGWIAWLGDRVVATEHKQGSSCASGFGPNLFGQLPTVARKDIQIDQAFDLGFRTAFRPLELRLRPGKQLVAALSFHDEKILWPYQLTAVELPAEINHAIDRTHWNSRGYGHYILSRIGPPIRLIAQIKPNTEFKYRLRLRHLASWNASSARGGCSTIDIRWNGQPIATGFCPACAHGGDHDTVEDWFALPEGSIKPGENTIEIELTDGAVTPYWINALEVWAGQ